MISILQTLINTKLPLQQNPTAVLNFVTQCKNFSDTYIKKASQNNPQTTTVSSNSVTKFWVILFQFVSKCSPETWNSYGRMAGEEAMGKETELALNILKEVVHGSTSPLASKILEKIENSRTD